MLSVARQMNDELEKDFEGSRDGPIEIQSSNCQNKWPENLEILLKDQIPKLLHQ
jgi:hypothetical protein